MSKQQNGVAFGTVTILVNVGGDIPLVLTGVVERLTTLKFGKHRSKAALAFPCNHKDEEIEIEGEVTELEQFLIVDVTTAVLPPGFPLTIAQLTANDIAVNLDYVILLLPVEV